MKPHRILKTFKGTQTGHGDGEEFAEGTVTDLSDHLAAVVVPAGLAEPFESPEEKAEAPAENKMKAKPANKKK